MKAPLKLKIFDGKVSEYLSELGKVFFAAKAYAERLKEVPVHNGEQPYAVIAQIFVLLRRGNKADGGACGVRGAPAVYRQSCSFRGVC